MLFVLTSVWVLRTPNAGQNMLFKCFFAKKLKICFGVKNSKKFGNKQIFYKIVCKSQLFVGKTVFLEKKAHFFGNKTVNHRSGANLKKRVFYKILQQISCFFSFLPQKMLKMTISTSIWSVQHPNAG